MTDDDVFYLFLQKQKIGAELHHNAHPPSLNAANAALCHTILQQGQDPVPMEIETPVTDRKRSHDKMESPAPAQGGPSKALCGMDFEEEGRGNLEDSDVADDNPFQDRSDSPFACFGVGISGIA